METNKVAFDVLNLSLGLKKFEFLERKFLS